MTRVLVEGQTETAMCGTPEFVGKYGSIIGTDEFTASENRAV